MKTLFRVFVLIYFLTYSYAATSREQTGAQFEIETLRSMQTIVDSFGLPSLSVAISVDEKMVFAEALGFADIEQKKLATSKTQYSVGSVAKAMTGIALARLINVEKVSLDTQVSDHVSLPPAFRNLNIRQLASHTAGIPHNTPERENYEFGDIKDHKSPLDVLDTFSEHSLLFTPGSSFKYSSNGYILLSALIESASNQSYVSYLNDAIWNQFGMLDTRLDTSLAGGANEAKYYAGRTPTGKFILANTHRDRSFLFGGGGFISTPTDLVKMSAALYRDGYLSEKTRDLMLTPVSLENGDSNPQNYALGWRIGQTPETNDDPDRSLVAHHGGVTDKAATAYLFVIPRQRAAIAFSTNTLPNEFWKIRPLVENILYDYLNIGVDAAGS